MRLRFEDPFTDERLRYQKDAIEAVCDLFRGQEAEQEDWSPDLGLAFGQGDLPLEGTLLGRGNRLGLDEDALLKNLQAVQMRNSLPPTEALNVDDLNFAVEMETGTGKTYVYLRTAYELNRRYGFTKFVIVVPSVAIREGVAKTLESTQAHFRALYGGEDVTTGRSFFVYESTKPGLIRDFAGSGRLQIMVVTVGAINKKETNNLYGKGDDEGTNGVPPIELIQGVRPILIVDEPQSVDGGLEGRGRQALRDMKPLCTLRYSATHATKEPMVYRLNAVDAYEQQLVKRIEVASAKLLDAHNKAYVRLISVKANGRSVKAMVEVDEDKGGGRVGPQTIEVMDGELLEPRTRREVYAGYSIGTIGAKKGEQYLQLRSPEGSIILRIGEAVGSVNEGIMERQMVRRTVHEHLQREKVLRPQGIKVLSLFFVARVSDYRQYDESGASRPGRLAEILEDEYRQALRLPEYDTLFDEVEKRYPGWETHQMLEDESKQSNDGYFAQDKKGKALETEIGPSGEAKNQAGVAAALRGFELIMKSKETLLDLNNPVKFIFSHSALKEGWDNPNVFQICNFSERGTERWRRQTIGRGLRLCVDQKGERLRDPSINILTVIANESYEEFAENLQRDIEADTGIRFGVVEADDLLTVSFADETGKVTHLDRGMAKALWESFRLNGYLDRAGKVTDDLRRALRDKNLLLPPDLEPARGLIAALLRRAAGRVEVKDREDRKPLGFDKRVYLSEEFRELWDRIKGKTMYRVDFDSEALIDECAKRFAQKMPLPLPRLQWTKTGVAIEASGVEQTTQKTEEPTRMYEEGVIYPNLISRLEDETGLRRESVYEIVKRSKSIEQFNRNPQAYIQELTSVVKDCKARAMVDGIKYVPLGGDYYAMELLEGKELMGYLENTESATQGKSLYVHVPVDSETERQFVKELEGNRAVKKYVKLPSWFKIETPLGKYNPDWAVVLEIAGSDRLYFVAETKSSTDVLDLRPVEEGKIRCGGEHFAALSDNGSKVSYAAMTSVERLLDLAVQEANGG
jgi:type III restriction enzyme